VKTSAMPSPVGSAISPLALSGLILPALLNKFLQPREEFALPVDGLQ
jgi:hypothetical protein